MAVIQHDAFNDPTNTTPDEISVILTAEEAASQSQPPTREERIAKTEKRQHDMFAKQKYTIIGAYALPPNSPSTPDGLGETADSSDLPPGAELAGFAVWQKIRPSSPPESEETDKAEREDPTLLNKFFAKMNRTREETMKGKSYWFLKLLTIHPEHQRKGVGSTLVNWGTQRADKEQIQAWLESSPMGKGAYLKAGFKVLGSDQIEEPRAKRGYVEWPYMLYEPKPTQ